MVNVKYRPDIDGLRAISILLVIIYHCDFIIFGKKLFPGGYLGVDVFFVISGYLITGILLNQIKKNQLSVIKFYYSRAKRLLPALFVTIFITSIFANIFFLNYELLQFNYSIISAIFFISNLFFWHSNSAYAAQDSLLNPLLHTWSLSIEWQFYICFPFILFFLYKFFRNKIIYIFLSAIVLSLIVTHYASIHHPSFSFYFISSRIFEILSGSALHFISFKKLEPIKKKIIKYTSILLIIISGFAFNSKTIHPSIYTFLLVVLPTCLIILSYEVKKTILEKNILIFIGKISYSLYLIHFPVLAILRHFYGVKLSINLNILSLLITLILSILCHKFVEKNFTNFKYNGITIKTFKLRFIFLLLPVVFFLNYFTMYNNDTASKKIKILNNIGKKTFSSSICNPRNDLSILKCFYDNDKQKNIVLIGDSQMISLEKSLINEAKSKGYNFLSLNRQGCIYLRSVNYFTEEKIDARCSKEVQETRYQNLKEIKNSVIIYGGRFHTYLESNDSGGYFKNENNKKIDLIKEIKKSLVTLPKKNNKVIILQQLPEANYCVSCKIYKDIKLAKLFDSSFKKNPKLYIEKLIREKKYFINEKIYKTKILKYETKLKDISKNNKNIFYFQTSKFLCKNGYCKTHDLDNIYYSDHYHLSIYGAEYMSKHLIEYISQIN